MNSAMFKVGKLLSLGCVRVLVDTKVCNNERPYVNIWVSFDFIVCT